VAPTNALATSPQFLLRDIQRYEHLPLPYLNILTRAQMEVYMHGIPRPATESEIIILLAEALHSPSFNHLIPLGVAVPLNFSIAIPRRQKNPNSRYGFLKIPVPAIGQALIRQSLIGSRVRIRNRQIHFKPGNRQMAPEDVRDLSTSPYIEPKHAQEWEERQAKLSGSMSVRVVQFGWRCRDDVFSPEWEPSFASWDLTFQDDRRQIVVSGTVIHDLDDLNFGSLMRPVGKRYLIVLKYSNIASIEAAENHETPSLLFTLNVPPTFETQDILPDLEDGADDDRVIKRQRVSHFDEQHSRVAPFTSNTLRLICRSVSGLQDFKTKCAVAGVRRLRLSGFLVEKRDLFSASSLNWLKTWYRTLDWSVAFQCISLLNDLVLDPTELRSLKRKIEHLSLLGTSRAREVLRLMGLYLYALLFPDDLEESSPQTVDECFSQADKSVTKSYMAAQPQIGKDLFACRHITFTPTMTILEGPTPEQVRNSSFVFPQMPAKIFQLGIFQSNRVFRWYPDHQEYFVRVNFTDEDKMQFRFEREVDGPAFVQQRVGTVLHEGFELAGRHFKFLGYSSSSLKEHSVWFCALFELPGRGLITRQVIVDQVGDFERVIHCPARFGARLSQAFSATDPSIALTAEEVHTIDDISRSGSEFTDGIGTMSKEVADGIWEALGTLRGGKRQRRLRYSPSAYQIRMGGYKGSFHLSALQLQVGLIAIDRGKA
jgi:RNA-dependent RNA polymerase